MANRFSRFMFTLINSRGFTESDPFFKKIGYSLFHAFFRPVTAINSFIRNSHPGVSLFFVGISSLAFSLTLTALAGFSLLLLFEGIILGLAFILLLNLLTMLSCRFIYKKRYSFKRFLATLSLPLIYMSFFTLLAGPGKIFPLSFFMTLISGLLAMVLAHFISLKVLTGLPTERLLSNVILIYFIFLSLVGLVLSLALPLAPSIDPEAGVVLSNFLSKLI